MRKPFFKIQKLTILILFTAFYFNANAQNSTIVEAYYSRAQQEYTKGNYKEAISFLESTRAYMGTATNPDITYLEAKAHYRNDVNVEKAKQLFLKFLKEATPSDYKKEEVSEIINTIETSEEIDSLGYFKDVSNRNGIKKTVYPNRNIHRIEYFENGLLKGPYEEYFENGKLFKEGIYNDGLLNGEQKTYYSNGKIQLITGYDNSVKHGTEKKYNILGVLTKTSTYANNEKNGSFKTFYEDGKTLKEEGSYKNNKLAGVYKKYHQNGSLALSSIFGFEGKNDGPEIKYHYNGVIHWIKNYENDELRGIQKYFYDNKKLSKWESYNEEGNLHGETIEYYKNGVLAIKILFENGHVIEVIEQQNAKGKHVNKSKLKQNPYGTGHITKLHDNNKISFFAVYTDGLLDGEIKEYYENGTLKSEGFYNYGSREGEFKSYYNTGMLKTKGNYKSNNELGFKNGEHTTYYETGELSSKTIYQYNQELEKTTYYKSAKKSAEYNYLNDEWDYFLETE